MPVVQKILILFRTFCGTCLQDRLMCKLAKSSL